MRRSGILSCRYALICPRYGSNTRSLSRLPLGRPSGLPLAHAAANPYLVRTEMNSRSASAK